MAFLDDTFARSGSVDLLLLFLFLLFTLDLFEQHSEYVASLMRKILNEINKKYERLNSRLVPLRLQIV